MQNGRVQIGELATALGVSVTTIRRQIAEGTFPDADSRTAGAKAGYGHRRWLASSAVEILRARSAKVPKAWETVAAREPNGGAS